MLKQDKKNDQKDKIRGKKFQKVAFYGNEIKQKKTASHSS